MSIIGGGLLWSYQNAADYSFEPNTQGFAIARNYTTNIFPSTMRITVSAYSDIDKMHFRYDFRVTENGSFNFIFIFPFKVERILGSTDGLKSNVTSHGTAIWIKHRIEDVGIYGRSAHIWGELQIADTFLSGSRGDYVFGLPFFGGVGGSSEIIDDLQDQLGVSWFSPDGRVELEIRVPFDYQVIQAFPQPFSGPDTMNITGRIINRVYWDVEWLDQQYTIICRNQEEATMYESMLFFGGIFISIGGGLMIQSSYDGLRRYF